MWNRITQALQKRASDSHTGFVLAVCIVVICMMSVALVWQAQIIANQREAIHWLEKFKFGS